MPSAKDMVKSYFAQWIATAAPNVSIEFAWEQPRIQFHCHKCGAVYRCDAPESNDEIPFEIQMYVSEHGLNGKHGKEDKKVTDPLAPKALHASFGGIDENAAKAEMIKAQVMQYKKEQEEADLEKKIKFLQDKAAAEQKNATLQATEIAKTQALTQLLQIMGNMKPEVAADLVKFGPKPAPEPERPKVKTVKIVQGRKFR